MNHKVIYNVLIGGFSVGLTFSRAEAEGWIHRSLYRGKKEIREVPYRVTWEQK